MSLVLIAGATLLSALTLVVFLRALEGAVEDGTYRALLRLHTTLEQREVHHLASLDKA